MLLFDIDSNLFARNICGGLHELTDRFCDLAVLADDLTHVGGSNGESERGAGFRFLDHGNHDFIGTVNNRSRNVGESTLEIVHTRHPELFGDAGFFENDAPKYGEELIGDQIYLAPEACQFICGEDIKLTCKIDVFALGILFHQYLTGKMPEFDRAVYDYVFEAVLDEQKLILALELTKELQMMIYGMLECDPEKRLSMEEVYSIFERIDSKVETESIDSDVDVNTEENQMQKWLVLLYE